MAGSSAEKSTNRHNVMSPILVVVAQMWQIQHASLPRPISNLTAIEREYELAKEETRATKSLEAGGTGTGMRKNTLKHKTIHL